MINLLNVLRTAAASFLPDDRADELARNLAQAYPEDVTYAAIVESVVRRRDHFALPVTDPHPLARALWQAGVRHLRGTP